MTCGTTSSVLSCTGAVAALKFRVPQMSQFSRIHQQSLQKRIGTDCSFNIDRNSTNATSTPENYVNTTGDPLTPSNDTDNILNIQNRDVPEWQVPDSNPQDPHPLYPNYGIDSMDSPDYREQNIDLDDNENLKKLEMDPLDSSSKFKRGFRLLPVSNDLYVLKRDPATLALESVNDNQKTGDLKRSNPQFDDGTEDLLSFRAHMHHRVEDIGKRFMKRDMKKDVLSSGAEAVGESPDPLSGGLDPWNSGYPGLGQSLDDSSAGLQGLNSPVDALQDPLLNPIENNPDNLRMYENPYAPVDSSGSFGGFDPYHPHSMLTKSLYQPMPNLQSNFYPPLDNQWRPSYLNPIGVNALEDNNLAEQYNSVMEGSPEDLDRGPRGDPEEGHLGYLDKYASAVASINDNWNLAQGNGGGDDVVPADIIGGTPAPLNEPLETSQSPKPPESPEKVNSSSLAMVIEPLTVQLQKLLSSIQQVNEKLMSDQSNHDTSSPVDSLRRKRGAGKHAPEEELYDDRDEDLDDEEETREERSDDDDLDEDTIACPPGTSRTGKRCSLQRFSKSDKNVDFAAEDLRNDSTNASHSLVVQKDKNKSNNSITSFFQKTFGVGSSPSTQVPLKTTWTTMRLATDPEETTVDMSYKEHFINPGFLNDAGEAVVDKSTVVVAHDTQLPITSKIPLYPEDEHTRRPEIQEVLKTTVGAASSPTAPPQQSETRQASPQNISAVQTTQGIPEALDKIPEVSNTEVLKLAESSAGVKGQIGSTLLPPSDLETIKVAIEPLPESPNDNRVPNQFIRTNSKDLLIRLLPPEIIQNITDTGVIVRVPGDTSLKKTTSPTISTAKTTIDLQGDSMWLFEGQGRINNPQESGKGMKSRSNDDVGDKPGDSDAVVAVGDDEEEVGDTKLTIRLRLPNRSHHAFQKVQRSVEGKADDTAGAIPPKTLAKRSEPEDNSNEEYEDYQNLEKRNAENIGNDYLDNLEENDGELEDYDDEEPEEELKYEDKRSAKSSDVSQSSPASVPKVVLRLRLPEDSETSSDVKRSPSKDQKTRQQMTKKSKKSSVRIGRSLMWVVDQPEEGDRFPRENDLDFFGTTKSEGEQLSTNVEKHRTLPEEATAYENILGILNDSTEFQVMSSLAAITTQEPGTTITETLPSFHSTTETSSNSGGIGVSTSKEATVSSQQTIQAENTSKLSSSSGVTTETTTLTPTASSTSSTLSATQDVASAAIGETSTTAQTRSEEIVSSEETSNLSTSTTSSSSEISEGHPPTTKILESSTQMSTTTATSTEISTSGATSLSTKITEETTRETNKLLSSPVLEISSTELTTSSFSTEMPSSLRPSTTEKLEIISSQFQDELENISGPEASVQTEKVVTNFFVTSEIPKSMMVELGLEKNKEKQLESTSNPFTSPGAREVTTDSLSLSTEVETSTDHSSTSSSEAETEESAGTSTSTPTASETTTLSTILQTVSNFFSILTTSDSSSLITERTSEIPSSTRVGESTVPGKESPSEPTEEASDSSSLSTTKAKKTSESSSSTTVETEMTSELEESVSNVKSTSEGLEETNTSTQKTLTGIITEKISTSFPSTQSQKKSQKTATPHQTSEITTGGSSEEKTSVSSSALTSEEAESSTTLAVSSASTAMSAGTEETTELSATQTTAEETNTTEEITTVTRVVTVPPKKSKPSKSTRTSEATEETSESAESSTESHEKNTASSKKTTSTSEEISESVSSTEEKAPTSLHSTGTSELVSSTEVETTTLKSSSEATSESSVSPSAFSSESSSKSSVSPSESSSESTSKPSVLTTESASESTSTSSLLTTESASESTSTSSLSTSKSTSESTSESSSESTSVAEGSSTESTTSTSEKVRTVIEFTRTTMVESTSELQTEYSTTGKTTPIEETHAPTPVPEITLMSTITPYPTESTVDLSTSPTASEKMTEETSSTPSHSKTPPEVTEVEETSSSVEIRNSSPEFSLSSEETETSPERTSELSSSASSSEESETEYFFDETANESEESTSEGKDVFQDYIDTSTFSRGPSEGAPTSTTSESFSESTFITPEGVLLTGASHSTSISLDKLVRTTEKVPGTSISTVSAFPSATESSTKKTTVLPSTSFSQSSSTLTEFPSSSQFSSMPIAMSESIETTEVPEISTLSPTFTSPSTTKSSTETITPFTSESTSGSTSTTSKNTIELSSTGTFPLTSFLTSEFMGTSEEVPETKYFYDCERH
nr:PREDICTED: probable GPI-anchored adhesin-like protein PGA55 [Fopius arisanus]